MAVTVTDMSVKRAMVMMNDLDGEVYNPYLYNEETEGSYEKLYKRREMGEKTLWIATGESGMISDAYVLYAIAVLRAATAGDIAMFLDRLHKRYPSLFIPSTDKESIKACLKRLYRDGYVFRHLYHYTLPTGSDKDVSLYSVDTEGVQFMNAILEKRQVNIPFFQAKQLYHIVGYAASAHTFVSFMQTETFHEAGRAAATSKFIGDFQIGQEMILKEEDGSLIKICFEPGFYSQFENYQTPYAYKQAVYDRLNIIRNYMGIQRCGGSTPYAVITVQSKQDLEILVETIKEFDVLDGNFAYIYITGYGILEQDSGIRECLQILKRSSNDVVLYATKPLFLTKEKQK